MKRARRNPESHLEQGIREQSPVDVMLDAMQVISVPLAIVTISSLLLRNNDSDVRVRGLLVNGTMAAAGFALRDSFPKPAFGMIGWGTLGGGVALLDLLIAPSPPSALSSNPSGLVGSSPLGIMPTPEALGVRPSGAVAPAARPALGYWEAKSSLNSGTSVVVPLG